MRVLFVVFVLSLAALVWTLVALRQHIRKNDAQPGEPLHLPGMPQEDSLEQND
jgi:hypothetical protein